MNWRRGNITKIHYGKSSKNLLKMRKQKDNKCCRDVKEKEPVSSVGGSVSCTSAVGSDVEVSQKAKSRSTIQSSCPTSGKTLRRAPAHPRSSLLVHNSQEMNQPERPSADEQIMKMQNIYTVEPCSAIQGNEIMKISGKWMELKNIILSEVMQARKRKCSSFPLYVNSDVESLSLCV